MDFTSLVLVAAAACGGDPMAHELRLNDYRHAYAC